MKQPNRRASTNLLLWILLAVFLVGVLGAGGLGWFLLRQAGGVGTLVKLGEGITPVDLTAYYDRSGSWDRGNEFMEVPRGPVTLAGVPFQVNGLVRLSGRSAKNDNKPYRDEVKGIPVAKKFARLHLLHIVSYSTSQELPYARVTLRYADGSASSFPMIYGHHGRDWHRPKYEYPSALQDPNTKVVWRGEYDSTPINGRTLRIFKSMFTNPKPDLEVAAIDLSSEHASPNATILAISVGPAHLPRTKDDVPVPEPEVPYDGEIKVSAVDENGKPLARVNLKISGTEASGSFRAPDVVTDEQGQAIVKHPGPDTRALTLVASGEGVAIKTIRLPANAGEQIPEDLSLSLERGQAIGGVVRDEAGQPIASASIRLLGIRRLNENASREPQPFSEATVKTDAQGRWEFTSLPRNFGEISATISHPDYVEGRYLSDSVDRAYVGDRVKWATLADMTAGFTLRKGLVVSGRVLDEAGQPVTGARLLLGDSRFESRPNIARSDETGAFRLTGGKAGTTFLTVQASGYAPQMHPVNVAAGLKPIELKLAPGHTLKLKVVDEFGTPVRTARVTVDMWQNRQTLDLNGSTDSTGKLTLDSAPESGMSGSIYKSGYMSVSGIGFVANGEEQTYILRRSLTISGDVLDGETKTPIARFDVTRGSGETYNNSLYWQTYNLMRASNGLFTLRLDQQNITALRIEADEYLPQIVWLGTNGETHFTVEMKKGSGPKGVVRQPNGEPAASAQLAVLSPGRPLTIGAGRLSRGDNTFTVANAQGAFSLRPQADGERIFVIHPSGYAEAPFSNFVNGSTIQLEAWGVIEGLVTVAGKPGTNEAVMLTPGEVASRSSYWYEFSEYRVTTDNAGRFVISNVPPGERRVVRLIQTEPNSWLHSQPTDVSVKPGAVVQVQIGGNGHLIMGQLALSDPSVSVNWRKNGQSHLSSFPKPPPFKSSEEYRAWAQLPATIEAQRKARSYGVQMGEDGSFRIEEVLPGNYDLSLSLHELDANGRPYGRPMASLMTNIVVPPVVKGTTPPPIDLGHIILPVRPESRVAPPANARRAATADGLR